MAHAFGCVATLTHLRLAASHLSRFAACSGAPSHRPSQGLGLRRFSNQDYSRVLRPAKWDSMINLRSLSALSLGWLFSSSGRAVALPATDAAVLEARRR